MPSVPCAAVPLVGALLQLLLSCCVGQLTRWLLCELLLCSYKLESVISDTLSFLLDLATDFADLKCPVLFHQECISYRD